MRIKPFVGELVTFYTYGEERTVTGLITAIHYDSGYTDVSVMSDGMLYIFGTGGHLGDTWTTESGTEEWFLA